MNVHQPRKRFGQHFLHDKRIVERIADAIAPKPGQHLIEIGPGQGALTSALLARHPELDVVELDRDLVTYLQQHYAGHSGLRIHQADALEFDFCALQHNEQPLRIVGNLPYNISTPLIFHLLQQSPCISDMTFLLQKEVVQRLHAAPGSKLYGRLSVMVQWRCQVDRLFDVSAGAFQPPPKVTSSVVRLTRAQQPLVDVRDPVHFGQVVKAAFGQRRKTLRNALKPLMDEATIVACGVDPQARAETLDLKQFAALSRALTPAQGSDT